MKKKLSVKAIMSLILSAVLFCMPIGAFMANSDNTVSVQAQDTDTAENESEAETSSTETEEEKRMAERAEKLDIIEKHKISSEKLQLLIKFSEDEILQLLAQKEKERTGNEEKVIS